MVIIFYKTKVYLNRQLLADTFFKQIGNNRMFCRFAVLFLSCSIDLFVKKWDFYVVEKAFLCVQMTGCDQLDFPLNEQLEKKK